MTPHLSCYAEWSTKDNHVRHHKGAKHDKHPQIRDEGLPTGMFAALVCDRKEQWCYHHAPIFILQSSIDSSLKSHRSASPSPGSHVYLPSTSSAESGLLLVCWLPNRGAFTLQTALIVTLIWSSLFSLPFSPRRRVTAAAVWVTTHRRCRPRPAPARRSCVSTSRPPPTLPRRSGSSPNAAPTSSRYIDNTWPSA